MRRARHRVGLPGLVLLVALALVPVALAGHRHATHTAQASPCATCLTVLHTPATGAPPVAHVDPVFVGIRVAEGAPPVQSAEESPLPVGRAPPVAPLDRRA